MLLTARSRMDEAGVKRVRELVAHGLSWDALIDAAVTNQVLPLVASSFLTNLRDAIPPATATFLEQQSRGIAARNMMMTAELFRVLDAFAAAGIPAFPYKGPTLAAIAYGGLRYRQFGDLDVLVPKDNYLRATQELEKLGFVPLDGGPTDGRRYLGEKSAHAFVRDTIHLDLQWGSTVRKALSVPIDESLWDSAEEVRLLDRQVRSIPADILFVFLCAHGARHHWDRLKWVCDVGEMIRTHPDLDWVRITRRAKAAGAMRVVNMAVLLADSVTDAPVPAEVLAAARRDSKAQELATIAVRHYLVGERELLNGGRAMLQFTMASKERVRDRVRFIAGVLLQPTEDDYTWLRLPEWLWFLYRILRPIRLAGRVLRKGTGELYTPHDH